MGKEIATFGDIEIEKNIYHHKSPIFKKMQILRKYQYLTRFLLVKKNYKYFIGYLHNGHKIKPLHIMLPKPSAEVKSYDGQTKWMYFMIENDDL